VEVPEVLKADRFQEIKLQPFPEQFEHYLGDHRFSMLNLEHTFDQSIDWNYSEHGKLWTGIGERS